ncbi:MAG TPA: carbohydrate binding domain-containing protein [archaeon]|nr:carbohydrate binding domain-containing protein [archaeon]
MRHSFCLLSFFLLGAVLFSSCLTSKEKVYPYRWVYASKGLRDESQVEDIRQIVKTASEHKINGLYLSSSFDRLDLQPPEYFDRLNEVKNICQQYGVEIIPRCLDVGYNGSVLSHNKNLAAGIPVQDALFIATKSEATLVPDPKVGIANSGFENHKDNQVPDFTFYGEPGKVFFVDNQTFKEGKVALRFENFGQYPDNPGRLSQKVAVHPNRCYRVSLWVKTEDLDPSDPFGSGRFRIDVNGTDGRRLQFQNIRVRSNTDWRKVSVGFNSKGYAEVEISAGVWEAKQGRFWLDGLTLEEVGLVNVLRRPGTPVTVRGEKNGTVYEEGRDYAPIEDPGLNHRFDHDGPAISLLPGSRIAKGERLRVSWYHSVTVYGSQVTACMSEPELYEIWRKNVRLLHEHLAPKKYFLSVDEVRAGGTCKACQDRKMTMGQILGDCITRQAEIVREVDPEAELIIWSDMLDPYHNAREREGNYYYHVDGSFTGSWNYVPKGLIIACWNHRVRNESLGHFSGLGFRTLACGYYDRDDLENDKTWLEALDVTPGALGIMYTTWLNKYELLGAFGDLVSQPRKIVSQVKK